MQIATHAIRSENASVDEQLKQSQEERVKLQREIAVMKQDAEKTWANERVENALLRERINDVAAEVARLTATLEGPGSPIAAIIEKGCRFRRCCPWRQWRISVDCAADW